MTSADDTSDNAAEEATAESAREQSRRTWLQRWRAWIAAGVLLAAFAIGFALWLERGSPVDKANREVAAGIAATEASEAVAHFQRALQHHPDHYGASYQLARALDRAGRLEEGRQAWQRVLTLAMGFRDQRVINQARARLGLGSASAQPNDPMAAGLAALYQRNDPTAAIALFRQQLALDPTHYGATYQLATALERAGDKEGARKFWLTMLQMATQLGDRKTMAHANARLAALGGGTLDPQAERIKQGMDALYSANDPETAIGHFRAVLEANPEHYGANYQLAMALDKAGKAKEATVVWKRTLQMAEANGDKRTADEARKRLTPKD